MSRYRCDDCGCILGSQEEHEQHRLRTHPTGKDLTAAAAELDDQWTMIQVCVRDKQWLLVSLAVDHHIATLQKLKAATERMLLG